MVLLNDNECITRLKKCCIKLVKKSMENTHPFLRDGITTTKVESLWQKLHGQRSIFKSWENSKFRALDSKIKSGWCSATIKSTTRLLLKRKENGRDYTTNFWQGPNRKKEPFIPCSQQVRQTKGESVRRNWRIWQRSRSSNRLEVLQRAAGRLVAFVLVNKLGPQRLDDEKSEFLAFFTVWQFVKVFLNFRPVSVGPKINFPTTDWGCRQTHLSHAMFEHVQFIRTVCSHAHSLTTRTRLAQGSRPKANKAPVVCFGVLT